MTRATHLDRGWSGHKVAACGSRTSELGTNVTRNRHLVDCKRCRKIIDWKAPESAVKPVDRRATVGVGETRLALLERLLGELVESADDLDHEAEASRPEPGGQAKSSAGVVRALTRYMSARQAACDALGIPFEAARKELECAK